VAGNRLIDSREIMDRAYGKSSDNRKVGVTVGHYDMTRLDAMPIEEVRKTYEMLRLAAPQSMGEGD
jgi:hypothetical protein